MSDDQNLSDDFECNRCGVASSDTARLIYNSGYVVFVLLCDGCQIADVIQVGGHDNPDTPENRAAWEKVGPMLERGERLIEEARRANLSEAERAKEDDEIRRADW
jgi:hypothetical protein